METAQQSADESQESKSAADEAITKMDSMLSEARNLVAGTDAIFERIGISREEMAEITMKTGVAGLGAQMRKEEEAAFAPAKKKKKRVKRTRVKL